MLNCETRVNHKVLVKRMEMSEACFWNILYGL